MQVMQLQVINSHILHTCQIQVINHIKLATTLQFYWLILTSSSLVFIYSRDIKLRLIWIIFFARLIFHHMNEKYMNELYISFGLTWLIKWIGFVILNSWILRPFGVKTSYKQILYIIHIKFEKKQWICFVCQQNVNTRQKNHVSSNN